MLTSLSPKCVAQYGNDQACTAAVNIKLGIEDRHREANTTIISKQPAQKKGEMIWIDARTARRVNSGHYRLVKYVDVEMHPERPARSLLNGFNCSHEDLSHPQFLQSEDVQPINGRFVHIRPCEVSIAPLSFTDLNHLLLRYERCWCIRPLGHERLTPSCREREVHPRDSTQHDGRIIIARVPKIAVSVDMYQGKCRRPADSSQGAEQDRTVATDDDWKFARGRDLGNGVRKPQVKGAHCLTIEQSCVRLGFGIIFGSGKIDSSDGFEGLNQSSFTQYLRCSPRTGFVAGAQRPQAEIGRSPDQRCVRMAIESGQRTSPPHRVVTISRLGFYPDKLKDDVVELN
jgi:hypothetical protein